jgi:hypothetical protein
MVDIKERHNRIAMGACGLAVVACASVALAAPSPRLVKLSQEPLVVQASGFSAGEKVRITLTGAKGFAPRTLRANARGRFRVLVVFANPGCGSLVVLRTRGELGHVAMFVLPAAPCVPPPLD